METIQIPAHKQNERRLRLEEARLSFLHRDDDGSKIGIMLKPFGGPWACTPGGYITKDGGHSFHRTTSYFEYPARIEIGGLETDPEKVAALQELCVAYEKELARKVLPITAR